VVNIAALRVGTAPACVRTLWALGISQAEMLNARIPTGLRNKRRESEENRYFFMMTLLELNYNLALF
jgi:hypothetical protein